MNELISWKPYTVPSLRFGPLQTPDSCSSAPPAEGEPNHPNPKNDVLEIQKLIRDLIHKKEWLLEEDQHLTVPPTQLDALKDPMFSLGDFCTRAQELCEMDLIRSSLDAEGNRKSLNQEQWKELHQTGQLTVPSVTFLDQHHKWIVAREFYSGPKAIRESFYQGTGRALDHVLVYTADSVIGHESDSRLPSWYGAIKNGLCKGLKLLKESLLMQILGFVGINFQKHSPETVESLLAEAERGYAKHHMEQLGHDTRRLYPHIYSDSKHINDLWDILQADANLSQEYRDAAQSSVSQERESDAAIYDAQRKFDETMNVRFNEELPIEQTLSLRSPLAARREAGRAQERWSQIKQQAWLELLQSEEMGAIGQIEANRIMREKIEQDIHLADGKGVQDALDAQKVLLKENHPIMSLSSVWFQRKLTKYQFQMESSLEMTRMHRIAERLDKTNLQAESAACRLKAKFRDEVIGDLQKRLSNHRSSYPPAQVHVLQFRQANWTFSTDGQVKRTKLVEVDFNKPFWRVKYTWLMFVAHLKTMIGSSVHFLQSGPLSFRALCFRDPYYAVDRPVRDQNSLTQTLCSRLVSFYGALNNVRERFEEAPDMGLIGKSVQRWFLRGYLGFKSCIGSIFITAFMIVGTMLATLANMVVLIFAPMFAIFTVSVVFIFNFVVYDEVLAEARRRQVTLRPDMPTAISGVIKMMMFVPYYLVIPGALQGVLATIRLVLVHPLISSVCFLWTSTRRAFRTLRDFVTWPVMRRHARLPAKDSPLASRIHGPGLASENFYRLPLEAARMSVLLMLDTYRIRAHNELRLVEILTPYKEYQAIFNELVRPFGLSAGFRVPSPLCMSTTIMREVRKSHPHLSSGMSEEISPEESRINGFWDVISFGINSAHPDFQRAKTNRTNTKWKSQATFHKSFPELDAGIETAILNQRHSPYLKNQLDIEEGSELHLMVVRSALLISEFKFKTLSRESRLTKTIGIPPSARGHFRLAKVDMQNLWEFSLENTELYARRVRSELLEIANEKDSEELRQATLSISNRFWQDAGARPEKDLATLSSFLLEKLLGGETMLQSLEETDQSLMLVPIHEEDDHLNFWRSF
eukprot:scaffold18821_cov51-Attheya_sp.AAC.2